MAQFDLDAIIVGGGAVGLACGYALSRRGLQIAVIEQEAAIGQGVSSRNSEVIHAGLYYPASSLKTRLCIAGRIALYDFLEKHQVAYARCGKLVVATDAAELHRLGQLFDALPADSGGVRAICKDEAQALEPELCCVGALLSPSSGVFDSHGYMHALRGEIEDAGGIVAVNTPFTGATSLPDGGFIVSTGGSDPAVLSTRNLVTAAGLSAQSVAALITNFPADRIPASYYGKGVYFRLAGKAPFERLIYPLPIAGALGTHYRQDLGGQAVFGPDLTFIAAPDYEVVSEQAERFYDDIRNYWPGLPDDSLTPDYAGVRPKIHGPGQFQPDFCFAHQDWHGLPDLVALFGIESPGLTASLAIGDEVAERLNL